jgi:hypothetical protein
MASKDYHQEHSRNRRAVRREYVAAIKLEKGCEECGYNKHHAALHLDHIDPSKKLVSVSRMVSEGWSFDKIDEEVAKCRILCANCHSIHTYDSKHFNNPTLGKVRARGS